MNQELEFVLTRVATLYQKYGIKSITMDDVARELAISKKTLYQYFEDKNDLVTKVIEYIISQRAELFADIYSQGLNAIDELLEVHRKVSRMMRDHSPVCDFDLKKYYPENYQQIQGARHARMYESIHGNMVRGQVQGLYRIDFDPDVIARVYVSNVQNLMESEVFGLEEWVSKKVYSQILTYHVRGIASSAGMAYFETRQSQLFETNP